MRYVIGIDEVGRGSLAGPVVVCAVAVPVGWRQKRGAVTGRHGCKKVVLRDSKKLSPLQREAWFEYFRRQPALGYRVARVYPRQIEKMNIARAANLAARRAYKRLVANRGRRLDNCKIILDGGLYLGSSKSQAAKGEKIAARTVARGDEKFTAIKIASIIAKVYRDRLMTRLAKKFPAYGFEIHKGYGTRAHLAAIQKCGPSPAHRLTFLS